MGVISKHVLQRKDQLALEQRKTEDVVQLGHVSNDVKHLELRRLAAGGLGGIFTKTATAPLERLKILMQVEAMQRGGGSNASVCKPRLGIAGTLSACLSHGGVRSLWQGNSANCVRVAPVYGLKFTFNDAFKDCMRDPAAPPGARLSFGQQMAAGTLAGLFTNSCTYPLETIRTRMSVGGTSLMAEGTAYTSMLDCAVKTVRIEGVTALYKGFVPTTVSGAPYVGLQMTLYETFKHDVYGVGGVMPMTDGHPVESSALWKLVSGASAGAVAQTITYPGDVVRRRMIVNGMGGGARLYSSSADCCAVILRKEGVRGFFGGFIVNLIKALPSAALSFWAYDSLKAVLSC